jgi:hypothetical protein
MSYVANRGTNTTTSVASSLGVTTTGAIASGAKIAVAAVYNNILSASDASISGGGLTWRKVTTLPFGSAAFYLTVFEADAPSGLASGSSITVTPNNSVTRMDVTVDEWSGIHTGALTAFTNTGNDQNPAATGTSILSTDGLAMYVGYGQPVVGADWTAASGWTLDQVLSSGGAGTVGLISQHRNSGASGTVTPTMTTTDAGGQWGAVFLQLGSSSTVLSRGLSETISISDSIKKSAGRVLTESISISDSVTGEARGWRTVGGTSFDRATYGILAGLRTRAADDATMMLTKADLGTDDRADGASVTIQAESYAVGGAVTTFAGQACVKETQDWVNDTFGFPHGSQFPHKSVEYTLPGGFQAGWYSFGWAVAFDAQGTFVILIEVNDQPVAIPGSFYSALSTYQPGGATGWITYDSISDEYLYYLHPGDRITVYFGHYNPDSWGGEAGQGMYLDYLQLTGHTASGGTVPTNWTNYSGKATVAHWDGAAWSTLAGLEADPDDIGESGILVGVVGVPAFDVASDGTIWAAYPSAGLIVTRKYTGGAWSTVSRIPYQAAVTNVNLDLRVLGTTPYLLVMTGNPFTASTYYKAVAYSWSGSAWVQVGSPILSGAGAPGTQPIVGQIEFTPTGDPVAFLRYGSGSLGIFTYDTWRWTGSAWTNEGSFTGDVDANGATDVQIPHFATITAAGERWMILNEWDGVTGNGKVFAFKWNGGSGYSLSGTLNPDPAAWYLAPADISTDLHLDRPVIAFVKNPNSFAGPYWNAWYAQRWNGSSWQDVAGAGNTDPNAIDNTNLIAGGGSVLVAEYDMDAGTITLRTATGTGGVLTVSAGLTDNVPISDYILTTPPLAPQPPPIPLPTARPMHLPISKWTIVAYDKNGYPVGLIERPIQPKLLLTLNDIDTLTFTLPLDDEVGLDLEVPNTRIKVWRSVMGYDGNYIPVDENVPIFAGKLGAISEDGASGTATFTAFSPFFDLQFRYRWRVLRGPDAHGRYRWAPVAYNLSIPNLMWALIAYTNARGGGVGDTGIAQGILAGASALFPTTYDDYQIWQALQDIVTGANTGGFGLIDLNPVYYHADGDPTLMLFGTIPARGIYQPNAVLHYHTGLHNCTQMTRGMSINTGQTATFIRETSNNYAVFTEQWADPAHGFDHDYLRSEGLYEQPVQQQNVVTYNLLKQLALENLHQNVPPTSVVQPTIDPAMPPVFGRDFFIGDKLPVAAAKGRMKFASALRVHSVELDLSLNGNETCSPTLAEDPENVIPVP